ncbi:MAG: aspartate dehydrogenase [Rhodospirillales bacterium]|nr:aspartate dehydrogenase [Rhodospirillales bacterium]
MTVAIGGLGTVGLVVARALDAGIAGLVLVAVSARDEVKARRNMAGFKNPVPVVPLGRLADLADVVVECAPPELFPEIARPAIEQGRLFVPLSVTTLLDHMDLVERAKLTGARIMVPTGALLGLDAVRAVAEGTVHSVTMVTRKPPKSLRSAKFVVERGIDLDALKEPVKLYEGMVREAAALFPANVNIAVALGLAGIGVDRTRYEIWADPGVERNTHAVKVDSDSTRFEMTIANIPTKENPATGRNTALSVIALLRRLTAPMVVGS